MEPNAFEQIWVQGRCGLLGGHSTVLQERTRKLLKVRSTIQLWSRGVVKLGTKLAFRWGTYSYCTKLEEGYASVCVSHTAVLSHDVHQSLSVSKKQASRGRAARLSIAAQQSAPSI